MALLYITYAQQQASCWQTSQSCLPCYINVAYTTFEWKLFCFNFYVCSFIFFLTSAKLKSNPCRPYVTSDKPCLFPLAQSCIDLKKTKKKKNQTSSGHVMNFSCHVLTKTTVSASCKTISIIGTYFPRLSNFLLFLISYKILVWCYMAEWIIP